MGAAVLGKYRLLRRLGRGGMGVVHMALAQGPAGFEKLVALKVLDAEYRSDPQREESLLREALIGGRLDHEHLVQIFELGKEADQYYIAMEYVRGFSLSHVVGHLRRTQSRMPVYLAVRIMRAVIDAVVYMHSITKDDAHDLGLVHGDISPSNILLSADGRVKLSDFGVVALSGEHRNMLAGKIPYLPPEALRGVPRTQNWDVYALGAVFYELLTGAKAFDKQVAGQGDFPSQRQVTPVKDLRPDCPSELARVIERTIVSEAKKRIYRARSLAEALDQVYPSAHGDRDRHRAFLSKLYAEPDFVKAYGELPSESSVPTDLVPPIAEEETALITPREQTARPVRFGLSPAHGSDRARSYGDRLARVLSASLDRPVKTVVLGDYQSLCDALVDGAVDLAWMPPLVLVQAFDHGAGVVAVAQRSGTSSYRSALVVKQGSDIQAVEDLAGRSAAFVDRQSASGYVFALVELMKKLDRDAVRSIQPHFHGSHRRVCEAVANGWVDFGATYIVVDESGQVTSTAWDELGARGKDALRIVALSDAIPGDCVAHSPQLTASLRQRAQSAITELAKTEDGAKLVREIFGAQGFAPGRISDYDRVRDAHKTIMAFEE